MHSQLQYAVGNPEDVAWRNAGGLVIGDGQHPTHGNYDLVIGDNPKGEGEAVWRLLGQMVECIEGKGMIDDHREGESGVGGYR